MDLRMRCGAAVTAVFLVLLLSACTGIAIPPPPAPATANADCVTDFNPDTDYFPHKSTVTHARGFTLSYFNHFKVIEVTTPWPGAEEAERYVLVQCGTPFPAGYADAYMIEVPIRSLVTLSTTYLPHLEVLDQVSLLQGVDNDWTIYSEVIRQRVAEGHIKVVGQGATVDVEQILLVDPDVIMAYSLGYADSDAHTILRAANRTVLLNTDFLEPEPLGRAEWLKVTAALVNQEAAANTYFEDVAARYGELQALAATQESRPRVFLNTPWEGVWYMAGGQSFLAHFLRDAGAHYLWADDMSSSALFLDFEAVYAQAHDADYWLHIGQFRDRESLLASDPRFAEFAAFQTDRVYNNDRRLSDLGSNDSWEGAVIRPHSVLADLIAIFHPHLLPEHEFVYYQQVE